MKIGRVNKFLNAVTNAFNIVTQRIEWPGKN